MAVLGISMLGIHQAIRQAVIAHGQAQDYTAARLLMERIVGERQLQPTLVEGSGEGAFEAPFDRFAYEWTVSKVSVPKPAFPPDLDPRERRQLERMFTDYLGKIEVRISWTRAGFEHAAVGETLLAPAQLWLPPEEDERRW